MSQIYILYLTALLMDMAVAGLVFAIGRRAAELGATATELGLLGAVWFGAYTALALVTGRISDRVGRRKVAITGCVLAAVIALACAYTTRVSYLLSLTLLFGAGVAGFWPSVIAWLSERASGARLAGRLTRFSVAWNIGLLLGFGIAGELYRHGPRLAFFTSSGVIVVTIALLLLPAREAKDAARPAVAPYHESVPKGRGFRKTAWLANFAVNFALAGTVALFPQLATHLAITADVHGALLALGRGAALVSFVALELLKFWRTRLWPLWVAQLVCVAGIAWVGWADRTWMFAAAFVVTGVVSGYAYQASLLFTLEEISERGKGGGFHEAMVGSGMFLGPILAGWVGSESAMRAPYFFCAAALAFFVVVQVALVAWRRKSARVPV
jgi:DHA1 family multidrug resistance protein-like MFS transporter